MTVYQVVAECAHATVSDPVYGQTVQLLYKGALVSPDAPELKRLLELGFVAKVGAEETGGLNADGVPAGAFTTDVPAGVTTTPVEVSDERRQADKKAKADAEIEERRAAARAKLPEGGGMPDGRAGQPVWVEYLVSKGSRYEDLHAVDKDDLVKLAKQQS